MNLDPHAQEIDVLRAMLDRARKDAAINAHAHNRVEDERFDLLQKNNRLLTALNALAVWYARDGSVGGLDTVFEEHVDPLRHLFWDLPPRPSNEAEPGR